MAQQQAYNNYPWAIKKHYHTGVHWANAIVQQLPAKMYAYMYINTSTNYKIRYYYYTVV